MQTDRVRVSSKSPTLLAVHFGMGRLRRDRGAATALLMVSLLVPGLLCGCGNSESPEEQSVTIPLPKFAETKAKAEAGDMQAANLLGEIYAEGKQVKMDYAEAAKWYRKAAEQGIAKAQYNLAVLCEIGQGVPLDETEAAQWYLKAAEQGYADAQYNLAGMYGLGRGVQRDPKTALDWYQKAAEQGDALARYNLAERYERGKDVAVDLVEALKWHSLAAEVGLSDAAKARDNIAGDLSSDQLADARKRIEAFKAKVTGNRSQ